MTSLQNCFIREIIITFVAPMKTEAFVIQAEVTFSENYK